jgi:hypothetical protein
LALGKLEIDEVHGPHPQRNQSTSKNTRPNPFLYEILSKHPRFIIIGGYFEETNHRKRLTVVL